MMRVGLMLSYPGLNSLDIMDFCEQHVLLIDDGFDCTIFRRVFH